MAELFQRKDTELTVEANQVTKDNVSAVTLWCGGVEVTEHDALQHDVTFAAINVPTNLGMRRAQEGDWIIQRPAGDFLVIPGYKFSELFEPVA